MAQAARWRAGSWSARWRRSGWWPRGWRWANPFVDGLAVGEPVVDGLAVGEPVAGAPPVPEFVASASAAGFVAPVPGDPEELFPVSASVVVVTAMAAKIPRAAPATTAFFLRPAPPSRVAANEPPDAPAIPPSSSRSRAAARLASSCWPRSSQSSP